MATNNLDDLNSLAQCNTCGRYFEDIYPAGRCPYEYEHEIEEDGTDDEDEPDDIDELVEQIREQRGDYLEALEQLADLARNA